MTAILAPRHFARFVKAAAHAWRGVLVLTAGLGAARGATTEVWETTRGERVTARLSGLYGGLVVLAQGDTTTTLAVGDLTDDSINRLAASLDGRPATASWATSESKLAKALKNRLQVFRAGKLVDFDPGTRPEPEFYLVYFGANWCPPCQAFSPQLVAAYERLKRVAPDKFDLVFVSSDRDPTEQLQYIQHVAMPWPVLRFSQRGRAPAIERWAGPGIPCLVLLTREGEALAHSYHGQEYVGPANVLERFEALLRASEPGGASNKRLLHRLAVAQHIRAAAGGGRSIAPYLIELDMKRYQTLEVRQLQASLAVDASGRVTDATFTPEPSPVLLQQFNDDAAKWLFLPAVENGKPQARKVQLPLSFEK